ncbi:MAG: hypothetical protein IJ017_07510 [Oscillospiraceae bacterium]|nr:hypothetical protein [Oscillospiraceae bacterium]
MSYTFSPISPRVQKMREKYMNTRPSVCTARYRIMTEFYHEHPEFIGTMKRAKNFRNICEKMPVVIHDDEIIVGSATSMYRGANIYAENSIAWLLEEARTGFISTRDADPYDLSDEDRDYILATGDFWVKECQSTKTDASILDGWFEHAGNGVTLFGEDKHALNPVGHFCTGYRKAIEVGFGAIKAEADAKMRQLEEDGLYGDSIERYNFYRGTSIVCEGMITFKNRYAAKLRELADAETEPERKKELEIMAEGLAWCVENPCRTFLEAVQTLYMYQVFLTLDACLLGLSFGRVDQYLGKFYEADLKAGRITHEYAQEIMDMFYLKIAEMNKLWSYVVTKSSGGYTSGQLVTLGGIDKEGNDATNPVTYMMLEAGARLVLHTPPQAIRIHNNTPKKLWDCAIETTKILGGIPSFENDEVIIPSLMSRGLSLEDARDYTLIGCVEPAGCGTEWPACGGTGKESYMSLLGAFNLAINDGYYSLGKKPHRVGAKTGYLYEMNDIEEVFEAYKKQVEFFVKWHVGCTNSFEYVARQNLPLPVASATMEGCMESGRDVMWGGAKYNSTGLSSVGIGNVVDSIHAIEYLCFKTKKCTTRELYDAVMANWVGYEELQRYIKNEVPRYGNAAADVDKWATRCAKVFSDAVNRSTGLRGRYSAGLYPVTTNLIFGTLAEASPDGRNRHELLADGISPVQQMDKNGPTAVLCSTSCIEQVDYPNGTLLNMKFHPSAANGDEGLTKVAQLIQTYFSMGGMEMQLNFISSETLRDALKNPQDHQSLVVRVAGFSAYFVELHDECKMDLITRTELML